MKLSTASSLRRLVPVLAASVLVFGLQASEVADASKRRPAAAPRRAVPAAKAAVVEARETIPATQSLGQVSGESVNIRLGPGTNHAVVGSMRAGEYIKARAKQSGWLEIDWPASVPAWVEKSDVSLSTRTGPEQMGLIVDRSARVYSLGNTKSPALATLSKGAPVEILGEQGTWYKIKAPAGATAYISARYAVTGLGQSTPVAKKTAPAVPASIPTPAAAPTPAVAALPKTETPAETKRAIPQETPVAPPPVSKAVLPAPTTPAAMAPEEPKKVSGVGSLESGVKAEAAKAAEPAKIEEPEAMALPELNELTSVPSLNAILSEYEALPAPTEEPAAVNPQEDPQSELKHALDALRSEPAAVVAQPGPSAPAAAKPTVEAQNELAKVIEETRQSIKQQDEPKRSVIDDNLQALETARMAAESRRKQEEEKQRASLSAALKQFEAMETRRKSEPEKPIDLGIDARTGEFLAPPEPAQPEKLNKLQDDLQRAFDIDQAKLALERDQAAWTETIRRAGEWRAQEIDGETQRASSIFENEENETLARLMNEDAQRLLAETERAEALRKALDAVNAPVAPIEVPQKRAEPAQVEQDILQALEAARRAAEGAKKAVVDRAETVLPDLAEETAKPQPKSEAKVLPVPDLTEEKYGRFVDPDSVPKHKTESKAKQQVEEIRALMFPTEPAPALPAGEPSSSKLPHIGNMRAEAVAVEAADASKSVELEAPKAQPVSAEAGKPEPEELPSIHDVRGIEVIPEPEGTIHEDTVRETNKRVKKRFVVPGNSPAPLGRRAEVISLD